MTLLPWEYFFIRFSRENFPDLFDAFWMGSLVLLVAIVVSVVLATHDVELVAEVAEIRRPRHHVIHRAVL